MVDSVQNNGSGGIGPAGGLLLGGAIGAGGGALTAYRLTSPIKEGKVRDEVILKLGEIQAGTAETNAVKEANALKSIIDNKSFDKVANYTKEELDALKDLPELKGKTGDELKTAAETKLKAEMKKAGIAEDVTKFDDYTKALKETATKETFEKLKTSKEALEKITEFKLDTSITEEAKQLEAKTKYVTENFEKLGTGITDEADKTAKIKEIVGDTGAGKTEAEINKVFTDKKTEVTKKFTELETKLKTQFENAYDIAGKQFKKAPEGAEKTLFEQVEQAVKSFKKSAAKKWALIGGGVLAALGLIAGFATRKPAAPADEAP